MVNEMTKTGNAVGFTAAGETITGRYSSKTKAWAVEVYSGAFGVARLTDERKRSFATKAEASRYAETLVDAEKTAELAWWTE